MVFRTGSAFDVTGEMMVFLEKLLGPYPFYIYGSIVVPGFIAGSALETQTLSIYDDDAVSGKGQLTMLHELFHHWYGNPLTVADWSQLWLHQGFARYAEALWLEHTQGISAYNTYIQAQYQQQVANGAALGQVPGLPQLKPGEVLPPADPGVFLLFLPT